MHTPLIKLAGLAAACSLLAQPVLADESVYKVGVTPGPHAQIMEAVQKVAADKGLTIDIIEFGDFVQPNAALAAGDINANAFQHEPYLDSQIADRGYDLTVVGYTITNLMGLYSKKINSLDELSEGARVGVPNDPTNGGRALLLLEDEGVITLKPDAGLKVTPLDVVDNPKKLTLIELDAAQMVRSLDDVEAAAINGSYAHSAGFKPLEDAIAIEDPLGPYTNIIVVRTEDKDADWAKTLVESYQSPQVAAFIEETFQGAIVPSWE